MDNAYLSADHELLQAQVARFLAREVEPHAAQWEDTGCVPREVLRRMGQAGLLGLVYAPELGGGGAGACTLAYLPGGASTGAATVQSMDSSPSHFSLPRHFKISR